jgi:hypothetical protein
MPAPSVQMSQSVPVNIVSPVSQGAGAFLSTALDLLDYEGEVEVQQNLGALSGAFTVPLLTASDTSGGTYTNVELTSGAFGTSASALSSVRFNASTAKRFLKYGATVGTSALISVTLTGFKKYR